MLSTGVVGRRDPRVEEIGLARVNDYTWGIRVEQGVIGKGRGALGQVCCEWIRGIVVMKHSVQNRTGDEGC